MINAWTRLRQVACTIARAGFVLLTLSPFSDAQVPPPPITSSGLNTTISDPVNLSNNVTQYNITGGARLGTNIFHSFGEFGVPTDNIANFLNETSLPTSSILGRVTGGNISSINGTIQTTGFGNANLFLMNPAGFLFGPNATVNVGGMVAFTSADYLKLSDNMRFNATPNSTSDVLLSAAPVAAFGFLGSNPGAIIIQGSEFSVSERQGISLVGGSITVQAGALDDGTVQTAILSAPGGQILLASVASPGDVFYPSLQLAPNLKGLSFTNMGTINLSQESKLDVSADAGGSVKILGGQLVIENAIVSADTVNTPRAATAVDIKLTGNFSITANSNSALTARTTGSGDAKGIQIASGSMDLTGLTEDVLSLIDSHTSGSGKAGNVNITTGDLQLKGDPVGLVFPINSGTTSLGTGGDATITAQTLTIEDAFITTGDALREGIQGSAGNLTIEAERVDMAFSSIETVATTGKGGNLNLNAREIHLEASSLSASSQKAQSGRITIDSDTLILTNGSSIDNATSSFIGGAIDFTGKVIEVSGGSAIFSNTLGDGEAGAIRITATERVSLVGTSGNVANGIFSNSGITGGTLGTIGGAGNAGEITITTPFLELTGGSRISSVTLTSGNGGNVYINAETVLISGQLRRAPREPLFKVGDELAGGVFTSTIGETLCSGLCGDAGNVSIDTSLLSMSSGSHINSSTSSTGNGGIITINAMNNILISGRLNDASPVGIFSRSTGTASDAGAGGNVALTAGQSVTMSDGASVSASSKGPGHTGNIYINAGQTFLATDGSVTTQANEASGGTIKITTTPSGTVQLTDSTISASVLDGTGGGGSVNIDPQVVILQNSQISAKAVRGPGGNISITTNLLLPDATSEISASSQFGLNGTVTIQSPNSPASGKINPLGNTPLQATSLLNQHCAALAGGDFSSFTVAGRDILPAEPGSWLASPLAALSAGKELGVKGERERSVARGEGLEGMTLHASLVNESTLLPLRQIAPAGFLTQAFAVDWSAGCQS